MCLPVCTCSIQWTFRLHNDIAHLNVLDCIVVTTSAYHIMFLWHVSSFRIYNIIKCQINLELDDLSFMQCTTNIRIEGEVFRLQHLFSDWVNDISSPKSLHTYQLYISMEQYLMAVGSVETDILLFNCLLYLIWNRKCFKTTRGCLWRLRSDMLWSICITGACQKNIFLMKICLSFVL